MEKLNDLRDLLKHEIQDLYSVEEQIIAALPQMIEKASNPELKRSLQEHLRITEQQKARLDQVQNTFGKAKSREEEKGLFSRLFKTKIVCKGMQGIIEEGNKILSEDMDTDVMDAAIIGCAQKIEHYEICGYGTAKAYARELNLSTVERLLQQSLDEEYEADDRLTALAIGRLNREAEKSASKSGGASASQLGRTGEKTTRHTTRQRMPQNEMEMAAHKTGSGSSRSGLTAKGTNAPKGSAGSRSSTGASRTPAPSKGTGSRTAAGSGGTTKGTIKSTGSSTRGNASSSGKTDRSGRVNGISGTR